MRPSRRATRIESAIEQEVPWPAEPVAPPPSFKPYVPDDGEPARADPPRARPGLAPRRRLRRLVRLPGPARRPHRLRLDPHRRHLDHGLPARSPRSSASQASILENNIVQTAGSAGESIAGGVIFTIPALIFLGFELDWTRTMVLALMGGVLGVLMMIPLRRYLIVKEHGVLTYPEGTACAEVLIVGEKGGTQAGLVFNGLFAGALYKFLNLILAPLERVPGAGARLLPAHGAAAARHRSRAARRRLHHRLPLVRAHGGRRPARRRSCSSPPSRSSAKAGSTPLYPGHRCSSPTWGRTTSGRNYIRYIGAGAVAAGGIINLVARPAHHHRLLPRLLPRPAARADGEGGAHAPRTERDIPITVVLVGCVVPRPRHDPRPAAPACNLLGRAVLIIVLRLLLLRRRPRASPASWARRPARSAAWPSRP